MQSKNFSLLMSLLESRGDFVEHLQVLKQNYIFKTNRIAQLNANGVTGLYETLQKKFYLNRKILKEEIWYENELRIFIWLLFAYLFVFGKELTDLKIDDWTFFSEIFNHKNELFFEFQTLIIMKAEKQLPPWEEEQTLILEEIVNQKDNKNHWNALARELFVRSKRRYFRTPKQCRERWMNHIDPSKVHTKWTISEDLVLLHTIKRYGKRWSLAVKELSSTRTEHMVKNRYNSLLLNSRKKHADKSEAAIESLLIKKFERLERKATTTGHNNAKIEREMRIRSSENGKDQSCQEVEIEQRQPNSPMRQSLIRPFCSSSNAQISEQLYQFQMNSIFLNYYDAPSSNPLDHHFDIEQHLHQSSSQHFLKF